MRLDPKTVHAPEIGPVWLNSPPLSLRQLRGRAPEILEQGIAEFGLPYPVMLDNDYTIWKTFANKYWPSKYLIDPDGYMRYFHAGEGAYDVQEVLRERDPRLALPAPMALLRPLDAPGVMAFCQPAIPELYLGHRRGRIANEGGFVEDKTHAYAMGAGPMEGLPELVISQNGEPVRTEARGADVELRPDGQTVVRVTRPRMYSLIRSGQFSQALLEISCAVRGVQVFAFTFGSCLEGALETA